MRSTPAAAIAEPLAAFAPRSPLRAWAGLDPARRFGSTLQAGLPLALRPSPLHLVFRALAPGVAPPAPDRVRFDALDFDAW